MKKNIIEFFRRGLIASGFGPIILAILYLTLKHQDKIEFLTVNEVCIGIFSLSALAFTVGGMSIVYQIEKLPLTFAILIHGSVLYVSYFVTYLINGWLEWGASQILIFSGIFLLYYVIIWAVIYSVTKKNTEKLNQILKNKQQNI